MVVVDDVIEGAAVGIGVIAVGAIAVFGGPRAKPYAKRAIKGYLTATQRAREAVAEAAERAQDLYAEARYEYEAELNGSNGSGEPEPRETKAAETKRAPRRTRARKAAAQPA
jgi:hypothetical protein